MAEIELEPLLAPLPGPLPCGADPEYDPAFLALQAAAAGKPEQQYGETLIPAEGPDWPSVYEQALQLAQRTRDLRVAVWLVRSGAHVGGLGSAVRGLQLVQGLAERHWQAVHPRLDASDHNDPTARVNALMPLVHADAALADLRAAGITRQRGALTLREIELAFGRAAPLPGESVPSEAGVVQAIAAATAESPQVARDLHAGFDAVLQLTQCLEQHLEASQTPEFAPLKKLLQRAAEAGARAAGGNAEGASAPAAPIGANAHHAIASRDDAIRALERVCEWIEHNEPSNPAPLLIRRSQRLMSKSFIDIIRDLVPDGISQVEKLAGLSNS